MWCLEYWCGKGESLYCTQNLFCRVFFHEFQVNWDFLWELPLANQGCLFKVLFHLMQTFHISGKLALLDSFNCKNHKILSVLKFKFIYVKLIWDSLLLLQEARDGQLYLMKNSVSYVCKYLGIGKHMFPCIDALQFDHVYRTVI